MSQQQGYFTRIVLGLGLAKRAPTVRMATVNESSAAQPVRRAQLNQTDTPNRQPDRSHPVVASSVPAQPAAASQQRVARPAALPDASPIARSSETDITTVIPAAASFVGDMIMETSFVLQCVVRGNVTQEGDHQIVVTETGGIHGTLRAKTAVIGGKVEGDVYVERLVMRATGEIRGNVHYSSLAMAEGAIVNGELSYVVPNVVGSANGESIHPMGTLRAVQAPEERVA